MNLFSFYFRKRRSGTNTCVRKKQEKVVIVRRKSVRVMGTDCIQYGCVCTVHTHIHGYGVNDVVHSERLCIAH